MMVVAMRCRIIDSPDIGDIVSSSDLLLVARPYYFYLSQGKLKRDNYAEERRRLELRLNLLAMHVATSRRKGAGDERVG